MATTGVAAASCRRKGKVALTVLCGIGRVLGFIGVGVIGARVVGAVSAGQPSAALVAALLAVAPLGALLCARGGFPREALPLLVLVAVAAFMPVAEIGQVARQLADTIASTRRLRALEHEPVTVADGTQAMPGHPTVRFDETGFTYPGRGAPAIDRVSFDVPPGSTVALVGPSGAGKSTVASLLLRFWDPQHGRVTLGGVDLRDLRLDDLRQHIALVAQDTYLFNDTLEANIRLAANDASAADVQRAIDHAALGEFVARLPDGLATRVGERGVQLSGGQRQRVAIARAFLKDAPVLILDEATSHLDTISEQQIRMALEGLMAHRTSIIIAHRLSTVRNADLIVVIEHGRVVEAGRHAELIARQGAYARLVAHQASGVAA